MHVPLLTSMFKDLNDTMLFRNIKIYTKFTPIYFDASLLHKYNTINKNIVFSCCVKLTMTLSQIHKDWACADPENSVIEGGGGRGWVWVWVLEGDPDKVRSQQRISQRVVRTSFKGPIASGGGGGGGGVPEFVRAHLAYSHMIFQGGRGIRSPCPPLDPPYLWYESVQRNTVHITFISEQ